MVILGGLEVVAAAYVWKELTEEKKRERAEEERHRRHKEERRHNRREHRRHDTNERPNHPPQSQSLLPPQMGQQRPSSAPPPQNRPVWQPQNYQPPPGNPQWQQQGPPPLRPQGEAQSYYAMQAPPKPPAPNQSGRYSPPPGWHLNLRTGKLQQNMFPEDMQPRSRGVSPPRRKYSSDYSSSSDEDTGRLRAESNFYDSGSRKSSEYKNMRAGSQVSLPHNQMRPALSPRPGYVELDAETPGRYRSYEREKPWSPPPPYRA